MKVVVGYLYVLKIDLVHMKFVIYYNDAELIWTKINFSKATSTEFPVSRAEGSMKSGSVGR